jgi:hypothetical protein
LNWVIRWISKYSFHMNDYFIKVLLINVPTLETWLLWAGRVILFIQFIPIVIGFLNKNHLDKPLKLFWYYCILAFTIELSIQIFIYTAQHHYELVRSLIEWLEVSDTNFTNILSQLNTFGLMGWFFYLALGKSPLAKSIKYLSIGLFFAALINYLFIEGYKVFGVFNPTADAIFSFAVPMFLMWHLYHTESKVPLNRNPYFWIYLRLIVPNLVGMFLYFSGDYLYKTNHDLYVIVVIIRNIFYFIGHLFAAYGFYLAKNIRFLKQS